MSKRKTETEQDILDRETPSPALQAARAEIDRLNAENARLATQLGGDEQLFDAIKAGIGALRPYSRIPIKRNAVHDVEHHAVVIITDTHADEFVSADEMEGMASHSWDTHEARMRHLADKVIELTELQRSRVPVTKLHVWMLGDMFLGQIHPEESAHGATMPLPVALPMEGRVLADTIMRMASAFESVRVCGVCGNHGRTTHKPVYKMTADRNWDMTAYLIAREFARAEKRIEWCLPKSIMHVENVMGWRELLTHGNCVQATHRTPYFAIEDTFFKQRNARRGTDQDFDRVWMGHFHHRFELRGFISGIPSAIGANQFSLYKMHSATAPAQRLMFYTEKRGPVCEWPITFEV